MDRKYFCACISAVIIFGDILFIQKGKRFYVKPTCKAQEIWLLLKLIVLAPMNIVKSDAKIKVDIDFISPQIIYFFDGRKN